MDAKTNERDFQEEIDRHPDVPTYKQEQFMRRHGLWDDWNCYCRMEVAQIIRNFKDKQRSKRWP